MSTFDSFIENHCEKAPSVKTACATLYDAFRQCGNLETQNQFAAQMKSHFKVVCRDGIKFFSGVRLKTLPTKL